MVECGLPHLMGRVLFKRPMENLYNGRGLALARGELPF